MRSCLYKTSRNGFITASDKHPGQGACLYTQTHSCMRKKHTIISPPESVKMNTRSPFPFWKCFITLLNFDKFVPMCVFVSIYAGQVCVLYEYICNMYSTDTKRKCDTLPSFSVSDVRICCFSLYYVKTHWRSLGFAFFRQIKHLDNFTLAFCHLWRAFFIIFGHCVDQTINWTIEKIICILVNKEKNGRPAPVRFHLTTFGHF